jgi:magnesium chelatase subunit D
LPHRQRRRPFEQPRLDRQRLDERVAEQQTNVPENRDGTTEAAEHVFDPAASSPTRRVEISSSSATPNPVRGRRNPVAAGERGPVVRAVADENAADVAVGATVRAAARRGAWRDGKLDVAPADVHRKEYDGRTGTLLLFLVDASGSMAARRRMELVKGTVLSLLQSAYEQRDEVAVVAFRGPQAEVLLPPTRSVDRAEQALRVLPTGGRTPLALALVTASDVVGQVRRGHAGRPILLVLLSDGRANVPLPGTTEDPWRQALDAARELAATRVSALVLDTDTGFVRLGRVPQLADALGGTCLPLEDFSAEKLVLKLRQTQA